MTLYPQICFVGQGPSRGAYIKARKLAGPMWAEKECARLALLGRIGDKISSMIGMSPLEYAIAFRRENLNHRFNGKKGKGDTFNNEEAVARASSLLADTSIRKFVLLGASVSACFTFCLGVPPAMLFSPILTVFDRGDIEILCLPHPSGINRWYNKKSNREAAGKALTSFIYGRN